MLFLPQQHRQFPVTKICQHQLPYSSPQFGVTNSASRSSPLHQLTVAVSHSTSRSLRSVHPTTHLCIIVWAIPHHGALQIVFQLLNVDMMSTTTSDLCEPCTVGKLHQISFPSVTLKTTQPLQLVHSDLWGPSPLPSPAGFLYYIVFIDDFTRFTWIYPLRLKSEATTIILNYIALVERQLDTKLKCLQTDFG